VTLTGLHCVAQANMCLTDHATALLHTCFFCSGAGGCEGSPARAIAASSVLPGRTWCAQEAAAGAALN